MALSYLFHALKNRFVSQPKPRERRSYRPSLELLEDRLAPAIFTVNTAVDENNGIAVGGVSLREAIAAANAAVGADTINFSIGTGLKTIDVLSALPTVTGPVTIDGNTQPGFAVVPLIELNGANAGVASGLTLKAAGSVVRGLTINNFKSNGLTIYGSNCVVERCYIGTSFMGDAAAANQGYGVLIAGAAANVRIGGTTAAQRNIISGNGLSGVGIIGTLTSANKVQGNYIGTNAGGNVDLGNAFDGVFISGGSKNNVIGGTVAGAGNVISGNNSRGVEISGTGATGNVLQGNFIGTNAAGTATLGNSNGVYITNAANNTVGGTVAGARNVISGNAFMGVGILDAGTTGNKVQGNFIGTNAAGTAALGNYSGVHITSGAANNTVGGTVAEARNVISGNDDGVSISGTGATGNVLQGNFIGTNAGGTAALGNTVGVKIFDGAANNTVGGTVAGARNVISGNDNGVYIFYSFSPGPSTSANKVQGNFIGTNAAGTGDLGNSLGVYINGATLNTVGGTVAEARNVISGNVDGVKISGATGNVLQGNFIGTNAAGTAALGNDYGVRITDGATHNTVGGTEVLARNVISGNNFYGVHISDPGTTVNKVQGNYIGTNAAGTAALGCLNGVYITSGATSNTVGGTVAGARNVISGNSYGVHINGPASGNFVQGNFIGTNAAGTAALGNGNGVFIDGAANNRVGGTVAGARNVISGNSASGVFIGADSAENNFVEGNFIGTNAAGTGALGNIVSGVRIILFARNNVIGGTVAGAGNRIANNGGAGVDVLNSGIGDAGIGNSILGNSIFNNAGLGIDLADAGATPNDLNDPDTGSNNTLNTPVLTSAFLSGTSLEISGFLNTVANTLLRIEFFANTATSQTFLGFQTLVMGGNNTIVFFTTLTVPATVLAGQTLTATITDQLGNTSEFSIALTIE